MVRTHTGGQANRARRRGECAAPDRNKLAFPVDFCTRLLPGENSSMATGSRQWAAAGLMGIMMCAVAVLQMWGSDTRSAMSNTGVEEGVLPSAAAEDSLAWRKAQRGQGMVSS